MTEEIHLGKGLASFGGVKVPGTLTIVVPECTCGHELSAHIGIEMREDTWSMFNVGTFDNGQPVPCSQCQCRGYRAKGTH